MNYFALHCLRKPCLPLLLAGIVAAGADARGQVPGVSRFANSSNSAPPTLPALPPSARLPDAPYSNPPMIRAMAVPSEHPFVLPRSFRITPAASRSDVPSKVSYYFRSTVSLRPLLEGLAVAGVPNIPAAPKAPPLPENPTDAQQIAYDNSMNAYGDQINAWGRTSEEQLRYRLHRFDVGLATGETRLLLSNLVLPFALHQDARFEPAPVNSDFSQRMWNAVTSVVLTHNDAGRTVPNYSKLGGTVGAAFLGKSLFAKRLGAPELDSGHFVAHYIGYSLLGDLATNTTREMLRAAVEPDSTLYNLHGRATDDSYYPMSLGGKVLYWAHSTYAPRNFVSGLTMGSLFTTHHMPQEPNGNPATWYGKGDYNSAEWYYEGQVVGWKQNLENTVRYHERRFIGGFSESESQMFLQNLVIPVAFDMDPRYVPLGGGYSSGDRLAHAFTGLVVSHTDSGAKTINLPVLGGTVGAAFAAKELYYPQLGTPALASNRVLAKTIGFNLAADAVGNIIGEFLRHRGY